MFVQRLLGCAGMVVAVGLPSVEAQTVRGVALGPGQAPVAGVVVSLVDSAGGVAARALSDEQGAFRLVAPRSGVYRLRSLRIGFRPSESDRVALASGQEVVRQLVLAAIPVSLELVRVTARNSCSLARDSSAATFEVWDQVRAALAATQLTNSRAFTATTVTFDRTQEPERGEVTAEQRTVHTEVVSEPWRSISPADAYRVGYVVTDRDGSTTYFAPGLEVLLSPSFTDNHCFRLTQGSDGTRLGLVFDPTPERRAQQAVADVRGIMWLDRGSAELRRVEFGYVNVSRAQAVHAGGTMEFARLRDGGWAISHWLLRMPALEYRTSSRRFGGPDTVVTAVRVLGGELALVTRGGDTLWSQTPRTLHGSVTGGASRATLPGARVSLAGTGLVATTDARGRFSIAGVRSGLYTVEIRTPSLDSIGVAYPVPIQFSDTSAIDFRVPSGEDILSGVCGKARGELPGIVIGRVAMRGDSARPAAVRVLAEWREAPAAAPLSASGGQVRWLETRTDRRGEFHLCGVPVNTTLKLRAERDSAGSAPLELRIPSGSRFARAELMLDRNPAQGAIFVGLVVGASTDRPIGEAEISLPELSKEAVSTADGAFRIDDVPPGTHRVHVRRLGYGPLDTTIAFRPNQTVERRIVLSNVVALDSVRVTAESALPASFVEHRSIGLGHFLTREELEHAQSRKLAEVLSQLPGIRVIRGRSGQAAVRGTRSPPSLQRYDPPRDSIPGISERCLAKVYVDNRLVNQGSSAEPFDVNSIPPETVDAVEWYAGPAQIPARYSTLNSACGVLVIWTRR